MQRPLWGLVFAAAGGILAAGLALSRDGEDSEQEPAGTSGRRLRVAALTQHFPTSEVRWAGHAAYQTLRILIERCDVRVFYPESTYFQFLPPKGGHKRDIDRRWAPPGVPVTYIPYAALPVVSRPLNGFVIAYRLLSYVRKFKPDVIFCYTVYPDGYAAVRIAKALGVPAVIMAIGSDLNRIPDKLCLNLTKSALRNADFVTAVSQDLTNTARRLGADAARSVAVINGCNTEIFHHRDARECRRTLGIAEDGDVIVYVGRLDVRKGLIELIDAVHELAAGRPAVRCYIVGDGPDRPLLVSAIARRQAEANVVLVPSCETAGVALWMSASTLVTLPSYAEGCPSVVVEGLASGRPIVATNVGGIPELVNEESGRLVPPKDVPALARALDDVLGQTWDGAALAAKHNRTWADVSDQCYDILTDVVERSRAAKTAAKT